MNLIALIILLALLLDTALNLTADILNLGQLSAELPPKLTGWYDADQYRRSQNYLRINTRFGWITRLVDLTVLLIFWFGGGFTWLDGWVRALNYPPVATGLIFIGALGFFKVLIGQPFALYDTFVIEARFGFNKTTWKTYIFDRFKALVLAVLIGAPLLAVVLLFFQYAGVNAWWYCWLLTVGFMLLMQYIAPTWIMPLFNKFEPLAEGELRAAILAYARQINFPLDNIVVMDGSKRSTKSNAFFTGFGRHRRIALFDTLIAKHTTEELVAVLAHEMGHFKQKHILKMMIIGIAQSGLMFYILSWFVSYPALFQAFGVEHVSVYAGLVFFGLLYAPLDTVMGIAMQYLSRRHEYEADRFAAATAPQGKALAQALKKLSVDNLSNLCPHPFYVFLNYSHPPVLQRIEAIEKNG
ncbi:MAG: M48 family metallopeptidase [Desulfobacteraceae bacterium]|nr:M48 family metallopeptidase [Desulfobacteraceae bacterium]